ncbi:hypothetical protein GIB67_006304 [Kingdonia uniflora]|uniref:Pentatricopeptide repeat-containing protein n=1 Tax=Kingdonia uniflora TaxID=39325 RepID=A0A7J7P5V8_9MAGN|nr:hypothetical protein GIB67_006304 [Kingdonia uniflora]
MAISHTTDWSLTSIPTLSKTLISPSNIIPFFAFASSNSRLLSVNSFCFSSPPLLQDTSKDLSSFKFDRKFSEDELILLDNENLNKFLCGLCKDPETEPLAFNYYQKVKSQPEFRPDSLTLKLLIRLVGNFIRAKKFKMAENLLETFRSEGDIAVSAFDSAMKGYNKLHMYSSTIIVYDRMKSTCLLPDSACYCRIMDAYRKIGNTEKVLSLFHEFESRGYASTPFSSQIYGILCDSLGKSQRPSEALEFFRAMINKGIAEDLSIYSSLICSFAKIREVKAAEELFQEAKEKKMVKDPELFLKLILMYVETGLLEKTLEIVRAALEAKTRISDCIFCTVVNGYSKKRGFREAIRVYEELISYGCEPGQVTYASIINVYCRLGLYSKAEMVFSEMEQKGFIKCVVAYSSMVSMYGKVGKLREAMKLVAKMKERGCEPNIWVYNSLLDMHGKVKNLRQVEKLWKEMKRRKIEPDKVSYTSIVSAYSKAREFDMCLKFYEEYRLNGGEIDRALGGIMVGVFSKSNRVEELVKLVRDMKSEGMELDARLHQSAMNAMRDAGLRVRGEWFEQSSDSNNILENGNGKLVLRTLPVNIDP